jgi:signal transduction histidine kinase
VTPFGRLPIRRKLVLITMLASVGALLVAGVSLLVLDWFRFRSEMVTDLETLTEIGGQGSNAALTFGDPGAATENLTAFQAKSSVVAAAIYGQDGALFAQWVRPGAHAEIPPRAAAPGHAFRGGSLVLFKPIRLHDEAVGTVYVESRLGEMYARLRWRALTVAGVCLAAALAALGLSSGLQGLISRPVLDLAQVAHQVSEHNDYSLRARKRNTDELGRLVDAFNGMLAQIEQRDSELLAAKEELEQRVRERTHELQSRNEELDQSNRELDDFAYIASHDLKEPLRGIHNYSNFLLEDYADKLDEEGRAKLETLVRLTRRMEVLIDSLLQFSRLGRVDLAIDDVDLNDTVAQVLESLDIQLREEQVEIVVPRPLPTVRCDRVRVRELYHNLIVNAIKYNDKPEKRVEIGWLDPVDPGAGQPPVLYVRDNGIGIQEKHFESIFRIFKRLHAREKFGGGTGAGLTIVKKIVERHNGRIRVESTFGEGTTFYFTLARGEGLAENTESADLVG